MTKYDRLDYKILGYGLLGSEIVRQTDWSYISRKKDGIDIRFPSSYEEYLIHPWNYFCVINCIANTDTYSSDKFGMLNVNYRAVIKLVDICNKIGAKLVQISTDYVYSGNEPYVTEDDLPIPAQNWYTYSKLLADEYIQARANKWLIIRTSFKPRPFPYEKAFTTQYGNFDYVDVIAKLIIRLIESDARGIYNVGTEEKSMYDLAVRTNKAVRPTARLIHKTTPRDIRMDLTKMQDHFSFVEREKEMEE